MSLLIFASIMTSAGTAVNAWLNGGTLEPRPSIITVGILVAVVYVNEGQRRIPIQYAKRMVGQHASGSSTWPPAGQHSRRSPRHLSRSRCCSSRRPSVSCSRRRPRTASPGSPAPGGWPATIFEFILVVGFTFFYTAVTFNPVDQADNLKKNGGFIRACVRAGRPATSIAC